MRLLSDRVLRAATVLGGLYVALFFVAALVLPDASLRARVLVDLVYPIPEAAAVVLLVVAGRRSSRAPWFWYLLALGMGAGFVGDANWAVYDLVLGAPPTPSLGDIAYAAQPLIMIGALFAAFRIARPRLGDFVDLAVPFAAVFFAVYQFVIEPQLSAGVSPATLPSVVETLAMVILMLFASVVVANHRGIPTSVAVFYAGTLVGTCSYPVYAYAVSVSSWQRINWIYAGFQGWFVLIGLAALVRIRLGEPPWMPKHADRNVNAWMLTAGLALVLAIIAATTRNGRLDPLAPYVAVAAICVVILRLHQIVRRQTRLSRELDSALGEQRRLATTDALTDVPNRRAFDELLASTLHEAARAGGSAGLVILDLDGFKRINDGYGHPTGDEVLREVAGRLRRAVRGADGLARIGGEEFAVIAPDLSQDETAAVAERCRFAISAGPFTVGTDQITVTTSAGTAHYPTNATGPDSLVQVADRALYQAKQQGRNRVQAGSLGVHVQSLPVPDTPALSSLERLADQLDHEQADQEHSRAMMDLAGQLCDRLQLSTTQRRHCLLAARLHDIGKIGVPSEMLAKPGPLTDAEWVAMRTHVRTGVELLRRYPETRDIAPIVAQHHERPDGTGYPNGTRSAGICIEAKIISVTDAWTAMLADRPYRRARTHDDARNRLLAGRGTQFDPTIADTLLTILSEDTQRRAA